MAKQFLSPPLSPPFTHTHIFPYQISQYSESACIFNPHPRVGSRRVIVVGLCVCVSVSVCVCPSLSTPYHTIPILSPGHTRRQYNRDSVICGRDYQHSFNIFIIMLHIPSLSCLLSFLCHPYMPSFFVIHIYLCNWLFRSIYMSGEGYALSSASRFTLCFILHPDSYGE